MFSLFSKNNSVERSAEEQAQVDVQTKRLALYQTETCPYCARVRDAIDQLSLNIEKRSRLDPQHRADLIAGGGKPQVPALRIEQEDGSVEWMYESSDIIGYLKERFGK
ncbi:MAG: glutathione S-transferase N-terminal domain-containing protein [Chloroflexota bacterium]